MKYCKDCVFFSVPYKSGERYAQCSQKLDPVNAQPYQYCDIARHKHGECRPEGRYFEQAEHKPIPKQGFWQRIFG